MFQGFRNKVAVKRYRGCSGVNTRIRERERERYYIDKEVTDANHIAGHLTFGGIHHDTMDGETNGRMDGETNDTMDGETNDRMDGEISWIEMNPSETF